MQKGRLKLNAVERKYICLALQLAQSHPVVKQFKLEEILLFNRLIKKINSGIRYEANNRPNRS